MASIRDKITSKRNALTSALKSKIDSGVGKVKGTVGRIVKNRAEAQRNFERNRYNKNKKDHYGSYKDFK